MSDHDASNAAPGAEPQPVPPPPYRTAPWIDPSRSTAHQPCQCPSCRAKQQGKRQRAWPRVTLVLLGGVVLPLVSLGLNAVMHVVELGVLGTLLLLASVASTAAHQVWSPRVVDRETGRLVHRPPDSTWARAALLAGAALSCVFWAYLGLFFLPLLPLSVLLVAYLGLGLCGLCPFIALAVGIIQLVRAYRAVRARASFGRSLAALLVALLLPPLVVAIVGVQAHLARQRLAGAVDRVAALPALSTERLEAVAELAGQERRLVALYVADDDATRRRAIAEIYHRLTDGVLDRQAVLVARGPHRRQRSMLRPFALLDGQPLLSNRNWFFPRGF